MAKILFIGLGVMGAPMAGFLKKAGHEVSVYNRTRFKADQWVKTYGGLAVETPKEGAKDVDFCFSCVGNDDDLREITIGEKGAFQSMPQNSVFIDHTTTSAFIACELAVKAEKNGFSFIDAPVSGGQAGAENGTLTVMCGGDDAIFKKAQAVILAFSQTCELIGPSGAGQQAKMVNQICIAGLVQALSEALNFANCSGIDGNKVLNVISKGAAGSWQMNNRGQTMLEDQFDFGFAVDWMRKDLGICLDAAKENGAQLPITKTVDGYYKEIQEMGGGRWDTSSLIRLLNKES